MNIHVGWLFILVVGFGAFYWWKHKPTGGE
jgi:hypothetical protein